MAVLTAWSLLAGSLICLTGYAGWPLFAQAGNADDFERRSAEHAKKSVVDDTVRYQPDKYVFVEVLDEIAYGEACEAEQALMEDLETKVKNRRGTHPGNVVDSVAAQPSADARSRESIGFSSRQQARGCYRNSSEAGDRQSLWKVVDLLHRR